MAHWPQPGDAVVFANKRAKEQKSHAVRDVDVSNGNVLLWCGSKAHLSALAPAPLGTPVDGRCKQAIHRQSRLEEAMEDA